MMRSFLLSYAQAGDVIDDVYMLSGKQLAATTTGKHYIKGFISDRSAQLVMRFWNATKRDFDRLPESGPVLVKGRVETYQQNLQLVVNEFAEAKEGTYEIGDLLPHTEKDIDQMWARMVELCESLQNRHVAAIIQAYLDDEALMHDFRRAPAAMNFHHAYLGGLLEHTLNAMEVADAVVRFYPGLSRDLVLAGVFLHDIAKCWELKYENAFSYTDGGQLVGHIVKSTLWLEDKARVAQQTLGETIPRPLIDVLQHIILSHHGEPEYGAARVPSTPEAIAVHMIENMDAKLMMSLTACRNAEASPGAEGNWTDYMKAFGGKLYRPDVAPADAPITPPPDAKPTLSNPAFSVDR